MSYLKKITTDMRDWFSVFSPIEIVFIILMTGFTLFVLFATVFFVLRKEVF